MDVPNYVSPGPQNPMGARAMYLYEGNKDTLYRIHGTNQPEYIGEAISSGCIRMTNEDVIDLYKRVKPGTVVVVLAPHQGDSPDQSAGRISATSPLSAELRLVQSIMKKRRPSRRRFVLSPPGPRVDNYNFRHRFAGSGPVLPAAVSAAERGQRPRSPDGSRTSHWHMR